MSSIPANELLPLRRGLEQLAGRHNDILLSKFGDSTDEHDIAASQESLWDPLELSAPARSLLDKTLQHRRKWSLNKDLVTDVSSSADRSRPDLNLFTDIRARYQSIVEHLLATENHNDVILSNFKARHNSGAFLCCHLSCPRSAIGFDSVELWKQHEDSHAPRFQCTDVACGFTGWTFKSRAALNKHTARYHVEEKHISIPESLAASPRHSQKYKPLFRLNNPSSDRQHPKNKEEGSRHEENSSDLPWGQQQSPSDGTRDPSQRMSPMQISDNTKQELDIRVLSPTDSSSRKESRGERRDSFGIDSMLDPPINTELLAQYINDFAEKNSNTPPLWNTEPSYINPMEQPETLPLLPNSLIYQGEPGLNFSATPNYDLQLGLLEQQNKERELMAQQERDVIGDRRNSQVIYISPPIKPEKQPSVESRALEDYEMQLKQLEQQNTRRLRAKQERDVIGGMRDSQNMSNLQPAVPEEPYLPPASQPPPGAPRMKRLELHDGHFTTSYDRKL